MPGKKSPKESGDEKGKELVLTITQTHDKLVGKKRKKRRSKNGKAALREIVKLQKTTNTVIPAAAFRRLCRQIAQELADRGEVADDVRFTKNSFISLQEAAEGYLVGTFDRGMKVGINRKRTSLQVDDYKLAHELE